MNIQERKYIAKRITDKEQEVLQALRGKPIPVPTAKDAFKAQLATLSDTRLNTFVQTAISRLSRADLDKALTITEEHWSYSTQENTGGGELVLNGVPLLGSTDILPLPGFDTYEQLDAKHKAATEQRLEQESAISVLASKCRDRAILGDGTVALAALASFNTELETLLQKGN